MLKVDNAPIMVEKYLQISDFMEFILEGPDLFLDNQLENIKSKDEERNILI